MKAASLTNDRHCVIENLKEGLPNSTANGERIRLNNMIREYLRSTARYVEDAQWLPELSLITAGEGSALG